MKLDFDIEAKGERLDFELKDTKVISAGGGVSENRVVQIVEEKTKDLQPKVDESLETESKQVVGAINEVNRGFVKEIGSSVNEETNVLKIELKDKSGKVIASTEVTIPKGETPDLSDYVKKTDYPTETEAGVVKVRQSNSGMRVVNGELKLYPCSPVGLSLRNQTGVNYSTTDPITGGNLNIAVIAALTDDKKILMTDDEKAAACETIGAVGKTDIATSAGGSSPTEGILGLTRYKNPLYGGISIDGNGCVTLYAQSNPKADRRKSVEHQAVTTTYFNDFLIEALAGDTYPLNLTDEQKAKARALLGIE